MSQLDHLQTTGQSRRRLPRDVWVLGAVSLLMDASSELVHALLPLFMASVLGASMVTIGLLEGVAEATASGVKLLSGSLSDRWRRRKPLVVLGYGLGALSKPAFPLAASVGWVFAARFVDRVGKGIRGAPRDALIADVTPASLRGAAFGLRQSLDSIGAIAGPALAMGLMATLDGDIRAVLWFAALPAALAVALLAAGVREPAPVAAGAGAPAVTFRRAASLPRRYWLVVGVGVVFTLARFSEAFLVLRAADVGLPVAQVPSVMVIMSATYALGAYPAGLAADRAGERVLLVGGLGVLVAADLILAAATTPAQVLAGAACWGAHMAFTQGLFAKLIADTADPGLRGTAFGLYNLATGLALFAASAMAGALWTAVGPAATFHAGAVFAGLAAAGTLAHAATRPGSGR
jgi:MFS family permease